MLIFVSLSALCSTMGKLMSRLSSTYLMDTTSQDKVRACYESFPKSNLDYSWEEVKVAFRRR